MIAPVREGIGGDVTDGHQQGVHAGVAHPLTLAKRNPLTSVDAEDLAEFHLEGFGNFWQFISQVASLSHHTVSHFLLFYATIFPKQDEPASLKRTQLHTHSCIEKQLKMARKYEMVLLLNRF